MNIIGKLEYSLDKWAPSFKFRCHPIHGLKVIRKGCQFHSLNDKKINLKNII